jgi:hypothetical protein
MRKAAPHPKPKWPVAIGVFVALGIVATVALTVIESWWG